jgi:hypothetical protein
VLTVALSFAVMFVAGTAAAMADAPTGGRWPDGEKKSDLHLLLLFGGSTLGLFILVSLFGLLTARHNYVPPAPSTELATTSDDHAPVQH